MLEIDSTQDSFRRVRHHGGRKGRNGALTLMGGCGNVPQEPVGSSALHLHSSQERTCPWACPFPPQESCMSGRARSTAASDQGSLRAGARSPPLDFIFFLRRRGLYLAFILAALSQSIQAAVKKCHRQGGLYTTKFISHSLGGWKVQGQGTSRFSVC